MKLKEVNGFNHSIIIDMYSFICCYEKLKGYRRNSNLKNDYPQIYSEVSDLLKDICCKNTKQKNWDKKYLLENITVDDTFYFKKESTIIFSILYHIRNSIAHGNITYNKGKVRIYDYNKKNNRTANALIKIEKFNKILNIINNNALL